MSLSRATAEPALLAWAALVTGADASVCAWENAPRVVHTGTLVLLSEVSLAARGADGAEWSYAAAADPLEEFTETASGSRVWTVQVSVEVHDQRASTSARHVAQRAVTRALWSRARAILRPAGLALASVGPVTRSDYRVDGRVVSRAVFEVALNTLALEADLAGRTSRIATVVATTSVRDPGGALLPSVLQPQGTIGP